MELLITTLAGLSIAIGFAIVHFAKNPHTIAHLSIALAFGAMLSLAIFDLGPEMVEIAGEYGALPAVLAALAGLAVLFLLDRFLPDFGHGHDHAHHGGHGFDMDHAIHIGLMATVALVVHNVLEGMTVYAISAESLAEGASYAFGIVLHNLPVGMLIYATLAEEEHRVKTAAIVVALLSTAFGGLIMMFGGANGPEIVRELVECAALGMVAYIVLFELLPQVVHDIRHGSTIACMVVGFALVFLASLLA